MKSFTRKQYNAVRLAGVLSLPPLTDEQAYGVFHTMDLMDDSTTEDDHKKLMEQMQQERELMNTFCDDSVSFPNLL